MQSLGLGPVLDLSSLGSWSQKFGTMYETTIFLKKGKFPRKNFIFGGFGGTVAALQYYFYCLQQLETSRTSLRTDVLVAYCLGLKLKSWS